MLRDIETRGSMRWSGVREARASTDARAVDTSPVYPLPTYVIGRDIRLADLSQHIE